MPFPSYVIGINSLCSFRCSFSAYWLKGAHGIDPMLQVLGKFYLCRNTVYKILILSKFLKNISPLNKLNFKSFTKHLNSNYRPGPSIRDINIQNIHIGIHVLQN